MQRIVAYERVSTARQGASGLGIEAQRQAIEGYAATRGANDPRAVHRGRERPQPGPAGAGQGAAPRQGHRGDAGDRQARPAVAQRRVPADAAGTAACGSPRWTCRRRTTSPSASWRWSRSRSARRSQGARRRRWRWPRAAGCGWATRTARRRSGGLARALRRSGAAVAANADRHARDLAAVVADIRAGGAISLRAIAAELNERGMLTRRGGRWHVSTVMNLLDRLGLRETAGDVTRDRSRGQRH